MEIKYIYSRGPLAAGNLLCLFDSFLLRCLRNSPWTLETNIHLLGDTLTRKLDDNQNHFEWWLSGMTLYIFIMRFLRWIDIIDNIDAHAHLFINFLNAYDVKCQR